ncbi:dystroglycan-like [Dorcoceras hygrometricum]|uniref:Dystroglycan-like n=1 Tax=Dorcoceras hygrometricum TaxID=472368 RepID=A0A2Z7AKF1_9LAMI|nr:dystroglycan-like [Dorcoceras hygrometricum]
MASSFYSNTLHVDFESVLAMENPDMVSVFNALMASGLEGFLGCPAVLYEAALVDFFENGSVRDGLVVSTVNGVPVEITEQFFAEAFELPVDGFSELSEIPKDKVFEARSLVSLTVKAGSFNAITTERFLMLTEIVCGVRINWTSVLFSIFKKMVTPGMKQDKGFSIQITLLLENIINLELDESSQFPSSKILTEKAIHRYIVLNDKVGAEEAADAPKVKKAPVQRAVSKKRPAAAAFGEPVLKKKRTMKKKSGSSQANLEIVAVAQEAVPIQIIESIPTAPADDEMEEQQMMRLLLKMLNNQPQRLRLLLSNQLTTLLVIADTAQMGPDAEVHGVGAPDVEDQPAGTTVGEKQWFDLPYEDFFAQMDADRPVFTPSDTDEDMETIGAGTGVGDQQLHSFVTADSRTDAAADFFMEEPEEVEMSDDEHLPQIPVDDKGKKPLMEKDPVKGNLVKEQFLLILADIECLVQLREKVIDEVVYRGYSRFCCIYCVCENIFEKYTIDVRRVVKELDAKFTYLDEQVASTRNDLLEFRATAQESLNHITDQLSKLVNYINRGGNDKEGEYSSSRGPQPPHDNQGRGSGNTGGDNIRTTDIVDRFPSSVYRDGRSKGRSGGRSSFGSKRKYSSSAGGPLRKSFEDLLG